MRKILARTAAMLLVAAGLFYLLYPVISDQLIQRENGRLIRAYYDAVKALPPEEADEKIAAGDTRLGTEGVTGVLDVPALSVSLPIFEDEAQAPFGVTHQASSAPPIGRTDSSAVLTGKSVIPAAGVLGQIGLTRARLLGDGKQLSRGDVMTVSALDRTVSYQIEEIAVTSGEEALVGHPAEPGPQWLTLAVDRGEDWLRIDGRQISVWEASEKNAQAGAEPVADWVQIAVLGLPVVILGLVIVLIVEGIRSRRLHLPGEDKGEEEKT